MENKQKEFLSYEMALALKELGFDEPCIGNYRKVQVSDSKTGDSSESIVYLDMMTFTMNFNEHNKDTDASALTYSQAFRFFREKHKLPSWVYTSDNEKFYYGILRDIRFLIGDNKPWKTYEEAELACLIKLIEINS